MFCPSLRIIVEIYVWNDSDIDIRVACDKPIASCSGGDDVIRIIDNKHDEFVAT